MDLTIRRARSDDPAFLALADRLSACLAAFNGDQDEFFARHNQTDSVPFVVIASAGNEPVACGGLRPHGGTEFEIKRMFTDEGLRGLGIGTRVLGELEAWAVELGAERLVLETRFDFAAAIRCYEIAGYVRIPNYPPYEDVGESVCMLKVL